MPFVYVHGVGNRPGPGYDAGLARLTTFLRRYAAEAISDRPETVAVIDAMWGRHVPPPAWDGESRPLSQLLGMGAGEAPDLAARLGAYAEFRDGLHAVPAEPEPADDTGGLLAAGPAPQDGPRLADLDPDELGDVLGGIVASVATDDQELTAALIAADELAHDPAFRAGLAAAPDPGRFVADQIQARLDSDPVLVGMGGSLWSRVKDRVGETFNRGKGSVGWAASRVLLEARGPLNSMAVGFIGDVFYYLADRGPAGQPGAIPRTALDALARAVGESERRGGEPIVVVTHSMGGQIVYDLLTTYLPATGRQPGAPILLWAAAASQVGLFEELKLFAASDAKKYGKRQGVKVPFPPGVGAWWNVWDPNDVISFTARTIFAGVDDEQYDSGTSLVGAHTAYFTRPSFFRKLRAKIEGALAS